MSRELVEGLIAELDGPKSDARVALCFGWMQLTQCNHGLAIALFIESDGCPEPPRIVIAVHSVIELDQSRSFDTTEFHPIGEALAIRCDHVEAPQTADAYVDLLGLDFKTGWPEPARQMFRVGPGRKHNVAPRINYPRENDFTIERPLRRPRKALSASDGRIRISAGSRQAAERFAAVAGYLRVSAVSIRVRGGRRTRRPQAQLRAHAVWSAGGAEYARRG